MANMANEELNKWGNALFTQVVKKFQRQMDAHRNTYPLSRNVLVAKLKLASKKNGRVYL